MWYKAEKTALQVGASICAELNAAAALQKTDSKMNLLDVI